MPPMLKYVPAIAFLILFPFLMSLGFWQLSRADEKNRMIEALHDSTHESPLSLTQAIENPDKYQYHGVALSGQFIPNEDVLLMHQMQAQDVGYHVLTPFQPSEGGLPVWIDRGFLSVRHQHEIPPPPTQPLMIRGIIDLPEPERFILGENVMFPSQRPLNIQRVDVNELATLTGITVLPITVLLETDIHDGLIRDWEIVVMPPEKHIGYAVQWFAMAACLVVIYSVLIFKKRGKHEKE
jgi:surfeit locus 1 family protein